MIEPWLGDGEDEPAAELTAPKQRGIPFAKGVSGNPAGRPKGARSKLGERFLTDLAEAWAEHGKPALLTAAKTEPVAFIKVVSSILPREVVTAAFSLNATVDLSAMERAQGFLSAYAFAKNAIGAELPPGIDLSNEAEVSWQPDDSHDE